MPPTWVLVTVLISGLLIGLAIGMTSAAQVAPHWEHEGGGGGITAIQEPVNMLTSPPQMLQDPILVYIKQRTKSRGPYA